MNVLTVLDYNIWFDSYSRAERTMSLIDIIEDKKPDIICLQEVIDKVYKVLLMTLSKLGYLYHYPETITNAYQCAIISRYPIKETKQIEFDNSRMDRNLIITIIEFPIMTKVKDDIIIENIDIAIATSHFESLFKVKYTAVKKEQFAVAKKELDQLSKECHSVIFGCDTNIIGNEDQYFLTKDAEWKDVWIELEKDHDTEYTYDTETNKNLMQRGVTNLRSRVDRLIFKGDIIAKSFELIKEGNLIVTPSDHHGIFAKLEILT